MVNEIDPRSTGFAPPAAVMRKEWSKKLQKQLDARTMTRKGFQRALLDVGLDVSLQAIGQWLRGETAPRPHHQALIAKVFMVPVDSIFPITAAA